MLWKSMAPLPHNRRGSSLLDTVLNYPVGKIAALVRANLTTTLGKEVGRHFNEKLVAELHTRVEEIVTCELPKRVRAIQELRPTSSDQAAGPGVSAEEVIACIEMILGRTPDPALVDYHLNLGFANRFVLGDYMISTHEFQNRFFQRAGRAGGALPALTGRANASSFEVQRRSLELLRLLRPHCAERFRKARFGSSNDGGYILIDDFDGVNAALSFGVEQNASWDVSIADRGVPVYQFDHTIDAPPVVRDDIIFAKKKIVADVHSGGETINRLVQRRGKAGTASLILKIDIEHDEWPVFDATSEAALSCFTQIVGEFHGLGSIIDPQWYQRARRVIEKITGQFAVVHVHANNNCPINNIANVSVPEVLEITFANKSRYSLIAADEVFPGPLDSPNDPSVPDIHLGTFVY